jgi:hypothetical protein
LPTLATSGGESQTIQGLLAEDDLIRWSADGHSLFLSQADGLRTRLYRLDPMTGQRELLHEIVSSDPAGLLLTMTVSCSADGKSYAYTNFRDFSNFFSIAGLK